MSLKEDLVESINDAIYDVFSTEESSYPEEAVSKGTYVRSSEWDLLGIITDGFYNEIEGQRVIIYTVLYFPNTQPGSYYKNILSSGAYMNSDMFTNNELEFDLTYYLMVPPVEIENYEIFPAPGEIV